MDSNNSARAKSGRLAIRYLMDPKLQANLRKGGVPVDAPVVVCEWETPVGEVMPMLACARQVQQVNNEHVVVVMRRDEQMFSMIATAQEVELLCDYIASDQVHASSYIGYVYEALKPKRWKIGAELFSNNAPMEVAPISFNGMKFELV